VGLFRGIPEFDWAPPGEGQFFAVPPGPCPSL